MIAEFSLSQEQGRTGRGGDDQAGVIRAVVNDVIVGNSTYSAFHVGNRHGAVDQLGRQQRISSEPASNVEAAAGLSADQAFRLFGHGERGSTEHGGRQRRSCK